ncbi:MAG: DUF4192 domain-containing protein [Saccharothrix sp.]|nr:DUF4192 domain-containing protein [Saccharothrix sp.]
MANPTPDPNPSTNTTNQGTAATLRNPGELIAATPHLIGYYPSDALVINIVVGGVIQLTTCYELPTVDLFRSLAHRVAKVVARYPGAGVIGMVVCAGKLVEQVLPCTALVTHLRHMIDDRTPLDMFWTAEVTGGARWYYYADPSRSGIVPNPKMSPVAAQAAAQGMRTFDSRDGLVNLLRPDPPDMLDRRATMIDRLAGQAHRRSGPGLLPLGVGTGTAVR